ncbi:hypothetical protein FGO68_gene7454 [Halteria grandinella]|uniref:Uncharacterized protein n=1 Tax=Halteria grandinella TaxID=5974 RepID=A0A8J8NGA1_HALGN|nr:hypothetical protein FGO68_gene7454 [Halteria grandinella]
MKRRLRLTSQSKSRNAASQGKPKASATPEKDDKDSLDPSYQFKVMNMRSRRLQLLRQQQIKQQREAINNLAIQSSSKRESRRASAAPAGKGVEQLGHAKSYSDILNAQNNQDLLAQCVLDDDKTLGGSPGGGNQRSFVKGKAVVIQKPSKVLSRSNYSYAQTTSDCFSPNSQTKRGTQQPQQFEGIVLISQEVPEDIETIQSKHQDKYSDKFPLNYPPATNRFQLYRNLVRPRISNTLDLHQQTSFSSTQIPAATFKQELNEEPASLNQIILPSTVLRKQPRSRPQSSYQAKMKQIQQASIGVLSGQKLKIKNYLDIIQQKTENFKSLQQSIQDIPLHPYQSTQGNIHPANTSMLHPSLKKKFYIATKSQKFLGGHLKRNSQVFQAKKENDPSVVNIDVNTLSFFKMLCNPSERDKEINIVEQRNEAIPINDQKGLLEGSQPAVQNDLQSLDFSTAPTVDEQKHQGKSYHVRPASSRPYSNSHKQYTLLQKVDMVSSGRDEEGTVMQNQLLRAVISSPNLSLGKSTVRGGNQSLVNIQTIDQMGISPQPKQKRKRISKSKVNNSTKALYSKGSKRMSTCFNSSIAYGQKPEKARTMIMSEYIHDIGRKELESRGRTVLLGNLPQFHKIETIIQKKVYSKNRLNYSITNHNEDNLNIVTQSSNYLPQQDFNSTSSITNGYSRLGIVKQSVFKKPQTLNTMVGKQAGTRNSMVNKSMNQTSINNRYNRPLSQYGAMKRLDQTRNFVQRKEDSLLQGQHTEQGHPNIDGSRLQQQPSLYADVYLPHPVPGTSDSESQLKLTPWANSTHQQRQFDYSDNKVIQRPDLNASQKSLNAQKTKVIMSKQIKGQNSSPQIRPTSQLSQESECFILRI